MHQDIDELVQHVSKCFGSYEEREHLVRVNKIARLALGL